MIANGWLEHALGIVGAVVMVEGPPGEVLAGVYAVEVTWASGVALQLPVDGAQDVGEHAQALREALSEKGALS